MTGGLPKAIPPVVPLFAQSNRDNGKRSYGLQSGHPESNLGVQKIISVYRAAESGYTRDQCDLFEGIVENDGHLRAAIAARTLQLTGATWQVQSGGDDAQSIKAAELLSDALAYTNFDRAKENIISCRYFGYSASEIIWERVGGDVLPVHFITVPHRRINFDIQNDEPKLIGEHEYRGGESLAPGKWIYAINRDSICPRPSRAGLLRTASFFSLFKKMALRDSVIRSEKFGIPFILGVYSSDEGFGEDSIDKLEEAVANLGEDGQAVINDKAEIKSIGGLTDGVDLHAKIIDLSNGEISKLITGATLNADSGGPGSFALGRVHETRAFFFVKADAQLVQQHFEDDIALPFIAYNGFTNAKPPRLKIHIAQTDDPSARMQLYKSAFDMGIEFDSEQFREEFQMRNPPSERRAVKGGMDVTDSEKPEA